MPASTCVAIPGSILGDAAAGTTGLLVLAPGRAIGLMLRKVKDTKGAELEAIRSSEHERG